MRDRTVGETFFIAFTTRAFATGIPTVLAGSPVVSAYEDASITQITAGITLGVDHDGVVGLNLLTIVATVGNGYEAGKDYQLVITTGTVGGVSVVGEVVGQFSLGLSAAFTRIGAAGAGLTAINLPNQTMDITGDITGDLSGSVGSVTAEVTANMTKVSGDTTAADNLELQYDTTGLTGDTFPSTQSQLSGIANVGSAVNKPAASYTLTTGTESANGVSDTEALNGTRHEHTDAAGAMDLYYEFSIGGGTPASVTVTGALAGNNDNLEVHGYDWVSASFKQIGTMAGKNSTVNEVDSYELFVDMVGSGSDEGKVRVRFTDGAFTLTSATLRIDQIFVSFSQGAEGYDNAAVWYDDSITNTGTEVNIDGTARNPVSTEAAVNTLLGSTNLHRIEVAPGATYTLEDTHNNRVIFARGAIVALASQDIDDSHFHNALVSGIGTAASLMGFHDCTISTASLQKARCTNCSFTATTTQTLAGDYRYIDCQSGVAGAGSPIFTKTAGQAITIEFRRWSGGLTISGLQSGDTITIGGSDMGTITLNGADATVEIRGIYKALVNNLTGSPTVNNDGIKADEVASILALLDDARGEPAQGAPPVNPDAMTKIDWLYKLFRNKKDNDGSVTQFYSDDTVTVDHKQTTSSAGGTVTKDEIVTGP